MRTRPGHQPAARGTSSWGWGWSWRGMRSGVLALTPTDVVPILPLSSPSESLGGLFRHHDENTADLVTIVSHSFYYIPVTLPGAYLTCYPH